MFGEPRATGGSPPVALGRPKPRSCQTGRKAPVAPPATLPRRRVYRQSSAKHSRKHVHGALQNSRRSCARWYETRGFHTACEWNARSSCRATPRQFG
eukprot:359244-Chlamydomonas_euryale.AAC.3